MDKIETDVAKLYVIANQARAKGLDPALTVESPPAMDMAGRVETLVGPKGLGDKIRAWKEAGADQDEMCFRAMDEVLDGKFGKLDQKVAIDLAVRVALAVKTEGVVSAPLEGIDKVIIRKNKINGPDYLSIYFAGPIRAAGGTVQAFAVLCADYVRQKAGIAEYKATDEEVERMVEEVKLYDRIMNLQYPSTVEEIAFATRNLRVELNGEPTEDQEVSAHRDLPRLDTNTVRGGPCLVLNDGLLLKSKKILKTIEKRKIPGWEWLNELKKFSYKKEEKKEEKKPDQPKEVEEKDKQLDYGGDNYKGKKEKEESDKKAKIALETPFTKRRKELEEKYHSADKFIADIIAGRPVFAYPSKVGGHRIRYGRSRNTGLAACGFHPSQMIILEKFLATGTQIRIERPGKSGAVMPVTSIEPPIVLMPNGDVKQLWDIQEALDIADHRLEKKILFLGDILFGYGEFSENNQVLIPSGYVEEWWAVELEDKINKIIEAKQNPYENLPDDLTEQQISEFIKFPFEKFPTGRQILELTEKYGVGIYPRYLDHWGNINGWDLLAIRASFGQGLAKLLGIPNIENLDSSVLSWKDLEDKLQDGLTILNSPETKAPLELVFCPHDCFGDILRLDKHRALLFVEMFGFGRSKVKEVTEDQLKQASQMVVALDLFPKLSTFRVLDKSPYYMGTRMGRPEKAKERKMKPPVQVLFPIGHDSKLQRSVQAAVAVPSIEVEVANKKCPKCSNITFLNMCPTCNMHTEFVKVCNRCNTYYDKDQTDCGKCQSSLSNSSLRKISLKKYYDLAVTHVPNKKIPIVKGVKGMTSGFKCPEPIEKGILRALNDVWVYKDGTIRVDAIDIPVTHFTPKEITTPVEKIRELGYDHDIYGQPITNENQVIELKVQDILLNHHVADYFIKVANYVDDELEYLYGLPRYYKIKVKEDFVGHYFAGLAPHTSAGIVGRLIGFSLAEAGYAHPFWQAAKRRNCFPPKTEILVDLHGEVKRTTIEELYTLFHQNHENLMAYSFDQTNKKVVPTNILEVNRIQSPDNLIEFELKSGRKFSTTHDHPVSILRDKQLIEVKAVEVISTDKFLLPKIDIPSTDFDRFDLIKEFDSSQFEQYWEELMVRDIKTFSKTLIENIGGLGAAAEKLSINKKNLFNYYSERDSIPFNILKKLLGLNQKTINDIPNCSLGFKYDDTFVPRYILNSIDLMKIVGYYIAEGYFRNSDRCYQIDIAAHEVDIREDILNTIHQVFGKGFNPYVNDYRITVSNRVLYYFFKDIMKLSNSARTKRVPTWINKLPLNKIASLLSAYFSGDGGIDKNRLNVVCSSYSRNLIRDMDLLFLRFGIFSNISESPREDAIEYKLRIVGENAILYSKNVGFYSQRKATELSHILKEIKAKERHIWNDHRILSIRSIKIKPTESEWVYTLNADKYHTVLVNEHIMTHQCDGDEDGIMLILEYLLNFSMYYLPASLGGKMDAPLVLSIRLDPMEVDGESHNVDYGAKYPLQYYLDTIRYAKPGDAEKYMKMYKNVLKKEGQYEGCMFTHPTQCIHLGPKKSAYCTFETMAEKIESQLWLSKTILAVDAQDVARKIISSHFAPDVLGNVRSFSTQGFRCPKCGAKFRRVPLSGACSDCGGNLLMTVSKGGITKYLDKAMKMIKEFDLGSYTAQRWDLINRYVESLTNNPRIKQKSISAFFK